MTSIVAVDAAISRYYKSWNIEYNEEFSIYCNNNCIDDEILKSEILDTDAFDSFLVAFDDKFPFPLITDNEEYKQQFVHQILNKCYNDPNISFGAYLSTPKLNTNFFQVTQDELNDFAGRVSTFPEDPPTAILLPALFQMMAIGNKYKYFNYLLLLIADYSRHYMHSIDDRVSMESWWESSVHSKWLKYLSTQVTVRALPGYWSQTTSMAPYKLMKQAMTLFYESPNKRPIYSIIYFNGKLIDDSMEKNARYICAATEVIQTIMMRSKDPFPFQIDFCMVYNNFDPSLFELKLKDNRLKYQHIRICESALFGYNTDYIVSGYIRLDMFSVSMDIIFLIIEFFGDWECCQQTGNLLKLYDQFINNQTMTPNFPKNKRFVILADRSQRSKYIENLWMYECPSNYSDIPKDDDYWYFNSTKNYLFPDIEQKKRWTFFYNDRFLIFSFHVKQRDVVQCYLYRKIGLIRFMPDDLSTILCKLFTKHNMNNDQFIKNHTLIHRLIDVLYNTLNDISFSRFLSLYK